MNRHIKFRIGCTRLALLCLLAVVTSFQSVRATGISIDAGLTPARSKWIVRTQVRYMERDNDPSSMQRQMKMWMFPAVVAYGLRSDLTVMGMQMLGKSEMSMGGSSSSQTGFTDLMLMAKYRMVRINTPLYTLGVAPVLGLQMPTGEEGFGSDTWDLRAGLFVSSRFRTWALDLNVAYDWNGMAGVGSGELDPSDELTGQVAIGRQFSLSQSGLWAFAPVLEGTYRKTYAARMNGERTANSGEWVAFVSPGAKLTRSNVVLEGLVQIPVAQEQEGMQLELGTGFLLGVRLMF